jgi:hypothetical protein
MAAFPAVDPIPLPAPVWLFKVLGVLTTALHFYAVEMLLGGLLLAACLALLARGAKGGVRLGAAAAMAARLPIVMTYVINLGVPPLLFAQVLYGRAIYTSSVLIGAWWIAVIPLLMLCYWLLYRFSAALDRGRAAWWLGAASWLVAGSIAKIYVTNLSLMVRPEVWQTMYANSAHGTRLPTGDPTALWRWLFMLAGGVAFGGLWMVWLGGQRRFDVAVRAYLRSRGALAAALAVVGQLAAAHFVYYNQPEAIRATVADNLLCRVAGFGWLGITGLVLVFALGVAVRRPTGLLAGWLGALLAFLGVASMALFRDTLRDLTLLSKGYDVWQRAVVTNWGVVSIFLVLFVVGLLVVGWLISVMARAKLVAEKAAS